MNRPGLYILTIVVMLASPGCGDRYRVFEDQRLIIPVNKTIRVKGADLSITNKGCGRKWMATEGKPAYEQPYCSLELRYNGKTSLFSEGYGPFYAGEMEVRIEKMNPWGGEEDSIPPGGCRVLVRKVPGTHR